MTEDSALRLYCNNCSDKVPVELTDWSHKRNAITCTYCDFAIYTDRKGKLPRHSKLGDNVTIQEWLMQQGN